MSARIYDKSTVPLWAQGTDVFKRVAQVRLTFTKFGHNYLQLLREIGFKDPKSFVYGVTAPLLVAGGMAVPFHGAIVALVNAVADMAGDDQDQEKRLWDWIHKL